MISNRFQLFWHRVVTATGAAVSFSIATLFLAVLIQADNPTEGTMEQRRSADEQLRELIDDEWETRLVENPLLATAAGDRRFNDQLPRESVEDQLRRLEQDRQLLVRLEGIDRDELSPDQQLNFDILRVELTTRIEEARLEGYLMPITNRYGFHVEIAELHNLVPLRTVEDYENYIARLRQFDRYVDDHIELLRLAIEKRMTLPAVSMDGFDETIAPHVVDDPTASQLYQPAREWPEAFSEQERQRLESELRSAIEQHVVPGFASFLEFMRREYLPATRDTIAARVLPNGADFYRHRVMAYTTMPMAPEEVHEIGLLEVRRIRGEMAEVMRRAEFEGSFEEFVEFLRTDPQFYPQSADELMQYVAYVCKRMDGELPTLFRTLPRAPYGIKPVPDYLAPRTTTAYYQRPAGDGTRAGFYFVNTYNLSSRPLYEVEALSLHEAVPGHHLQIALQQELADLPMFRRFSSITAFIEGWALYAERLGLEVGFYEDPYSDFGRLSYEMWRACRLVVDTGMHYLGWTREQAIDFMAQNTSLSMHNIRSEVDRYITWPGQALAYKIGEIKIRELRQMAEELLGADFDVREFHDVVLLSGSVPLTVLEHNVRTWLEGKAD